MPEPVDAWWARRQRSRDLAVPYPVGSYRAAWQSFPVLVRQYRPEYNGGIVLSQVPPGAEVYLCWLCDAGHLFVATPAEQRSRPGRERRRSSWCPECLELAQGRTPPGLRVLPPSVSPSPAPASSLASAPGGGSGSAPSPAAVRPQRRADRATGVPRSRTASRPVCVKTPNIPAGEAFASSCAPPPASAVEAQLRADLAERLEFAAGLNAVRLSRPFFDHLEAWPDIVLSDLRVAIEYDSTGRHGLEHVGKREDADRRKDRALRAAGWEVVRVRSGRLPLLGPHDLQVSGLTKQTVPRILETLRAIRGDLFVDSYLRR